ncbi:MAG: restriction endonuclease subunit S [Betaproteobacteria bacterium]|nr:restriction endonuclease subunit S [Betaproteobacteria bacterium]
MSNPADLVYTIAKDKLPAEWSLATISDLAGKDGVFVDGDWVESKDQDPDGDVRLIQLADIGDGEYRNKSKRFLTHEKAIQLGCTYLEKGDVLIARMPDPLGRACIYPGDKKKSVTVVDVAIVRPAGNAFDARWLMYFVNAPAFRSAVASMQSGSTRKRISRGNLSKIVLPVPPLDQQKRIVAEIEKQFSRLDEAVANLKRVKANLKCYKAAVLKAAVEGRLVETEAERARREGRSYETGTQLLQRILETRRSQWQGKGKYKEPAAPDTTDLPELPEGWGWANVDQLAEVGTGATPKRDQARYYGGDIPWVTSAVVNDTFVDHAAEFVTSDALAETNLTLYQPGTLLVAMYGEGKTRGKCSELRIAATTNQALAALRADENVRPYLKQFLEYNYEEMRKVASGGVQPNLNLSLVRAVCVPLPPMAEQHRIVAEVDRRLTLLRATEAQVDANLQRAERLRQTILTSAFSGGIHRSKVIQSFTATPTI